MTNYRNNEIVIVGNLKAYLSTPERPCEIVRQNQVTKAPNYPYVAYTVTTPISGHSGTYSQAEDGTLYKSILQTWSFTVQSDDQEEALLLAMKIYNFFSVVGHTVLADNDITVRTVGNVNARDNLLSIQYEYRNGLDVTFGLLYVIAPEDQISHDVIETIENTDRNEPVRSAVLGIAILGAMRLGND